jgi:hypothetical protein
MSNNNQSKKIWSSDYVVIGFFSLFALVLHLVAIEGFGYFRDELYYISCSEHLAFGYVDQPPLSILLLKLIRLVLGDSVLAIRLLPAIASGLFVFLTGMMAKELGGKRFAVILAPVTALAPIGNFFIYSVYSMNFLDHLFWSACILTVLRIIKTGEAKYWLFFGLIAGLGLQNKISILFLCFGIAVGILLTKERKYLKSKYLWLGAGLAGLLFLPYILWNMSHDWATLEFMQNARTMKMTAVSALEFLKEQVLYNNYASLFIWLAGLGFFFFHKEGKKYRLFGWMYLSIYLLFTIQQAKAYYLAPVYPILFAGGAVLIESWLDRKYWKVLRPVLVIAIIVPTLLFCPAALPILPQETTIQWLQKLGIDAKSGENHEIGALPQHFADMHGWEEMTLKVANAYDSLTDEEKKECVLFATNYGVTGALNFMGKKYGLPPAFSGHNNHYFWPPDDYTGNVVIIVGISKQELGNIFNDIIETDRTFSKYAMPYENNKPILICRRIKLPLKELWPRLKHFE